MNFPLLKSGFSASFAHQKMNVVGASMASYLTRNRSRYIFLHKFVWCPFDDIHKLLKGELVSASIVLLQKYHFFQCHALHYLCRLEELQDLAPYDFYADYEVVSANANNQEDLLVFENNKHFQHPSYKMKQERFL